MVRVGDPLLAVQLSNLFRDSRWEVRNPVKQGWRNKGCNKGCNKERHKGCHKGCSFLRNHLRVILTQS